ncbi:MAG TPA: dephospho-CoA kinase [Bacteroidia bacterium]|jgi:dephospho-CoA kinase|nr:dephospho-CoA kinase [Bacteroidia bacterium]
MALQVGITGGIGSGKSVVCDIFRLLGVAIFNSDLEGRRILEDDTEVKNKVKAIFGPGAYRADGLPDRKYIASQAFTDASKLKALNGVIHPAVASRFQYWCAEHASDAYVLKEAAVLVESGAYKEMDKVILVSAPQALKLSRAAKRDNLSEEEIQKRSRNQLSEAELLHHAQYVIVNDEQQLLIPQVLKLHEQLKKDAQSHSRA